MNSDKEPRSDENKAEPKPLDPMAAGNGSAVVVQPKKENALIDLGLDGHHLVFRVDGYLILLGCISLIVFCLIKKKWMWGLKSDLKSVVLKFGGLPEATIEVNRDTQKIAFAAYTELVTRKIALPFDEEHDVIADVYKSWYQMFTTTRELIKQVPAHHIARSNDTRNLVQSLIDLLNLGMRPHLTRWHARFRHWYEHALSSPENAGIPPQDIQKMFPDYAAMVSDLKAVNANFHEYAFQLRTLAEARKQPPLKAAKP